MKHKGRMILFTVLLAGAAFGGVSELREGAFTVKPNPCPSCPMRMRFTPDGKTAFINTSRVSEREFPAEARRAFSLMRKGADTAKGGVRRPLMGWSNWNSIKKLIGENLYLGAYIRPGHYNDLDMLQVGRYVGEIKNAYVKADTGLTLEEEATHFGMWCFLSSPLLLGCDVRSLPETTYELVTNPYLLMMNQNDLAAQPKVVQRRGEAYAIVKDADEIFGRARYLALYNAEDTAQDFDVPFEKLGLYGKVRAFDLGERADLEIQETRLFVNVPAHGAKFFRLDAERRDLPPSGAPLPGIDYLEVR